jgi:DNA-binding beta-propeller fold protein YncE
MTEGVFFVVSGRWDNVVSIVDLDRALDPATFGTDKAIRNRLRVTPDITGPDGRPVPASGQPVSVAIPPGGEVAFIVNHSGTASEADASAFQHGHPGTVTVLDLKKALDPANDGTLNAVETIVPTQTAGPVGCTITADARLAAIASAEAPGHEDGGRQITLFDIARRRIAGQIELRVASAQARPSPHAAPHQTFGFFPNPNGIAASPLHGGLLVTGNGGSDDVSIVRIGARSGEVSGAEVARVAVEAGPFGVAVSPDGHLAAVANRENPRTGVEGSTVSIIDIDRAIAGETRAEVARIHVGSDRPGEATRPFAVAFTPNGKYLLTSCFRSNTLSLIDIDRALDGDAKEARRLHLSTPGGGPGRPRGIAVTPDGRHAAVIGGAKKGPGSSVVFLIDIASFSVVGLVTGVGNESYMLAAFAASPA